MLNELEEKYITVNMNPYQFENIVSEILSKEKNIPHYVTGWNYDLGNDIKTYTRDNITIQCKTIQGSNFDKFKKSLLKLKNTSSSQYFLYVNIRLTEKFINKLKMNGINEVYDLFWVMKGIEEHNLLHLLPNLSKLLINKKTNSAKREIISFFENDTAIEQAKIFNKFIYSNLYKKLLLSLKKEKLTIFLGEEGSGKTITSIFLFSEFLLNDSFIPLFLFRPISYRDIRLKLASLLKFDNKKIILFIDDFLGSYLNDRNINNDLVNDLNNLISFCSKNNIHLFLNCREEIFKYKIKRIINNGELIFKDHWIKAQNKSIINMGSIDYKTRTLIFKSLLEKNVVEKSNFRDSDVLKIVKHNNFKPRILSVSINKKLHKDLLNLLDNPEILYENIINNGLNKKQKVILEVLFKLNKYIKFVPKWVLIQELSKTYIFESEKEIVEKINELIDFCLNEFISSSRRVTILEFLNPKIKECIESFKFDLSKEGFSFRIENYDFNEINFLEEINNLNLSKNIFTLDVKTMKILIENNYYDYSILKEFVPIFLKDHLFSDLNIEVDFDTFLNLSEETNIIEIISRDPDEYFEDLIESNFIMSDLKTRLFSSVNNFIEEQDDDFFDKDIDIKTLLLQESEDIFSSTFLNESDLFNEDLFSKIKKNLIDFCLDENDWNEIITNEIEERKDSNKAYHFHGKEIKSEKNIGDIEILNIFRK